MAEGIINPPTASEKRPNHHCSQIFTRAGVNTSVWALSWPSQAPPPPLQWKNHHRARGAGWRRGGIKWVRAGLWSDRLKNLTHKSLGLFILWIEIAHSFIGVAWTSRQDVTFLLECHSRQQPQWWSWSAVKKQDLALGVDLKWKCHNKAMCVRVCGFVAFLEQLKLLVLFLMIVGEILWFN